MAIAKKKGASDDPVTSITPSDTAAMAPRQAPSSGDYVIVGCKLPHGLILELIEPGSVSGLAAGDERKGLGRPAPVRPGARIKLNGANSIGIIGAVPRAQGTHPFGLTRVKREVWEEWSQRNQEFEFLRNGLIFAVDGGSGGMGVQKANANAIAVAKERLGVRTGLEALDPEAGKDARLKAVRIPGRPETEIVPDDTYYGQQMRQAASALTPDQISYEG